jgi:hypothetical protein
MMLTYKAQSFTHEQERLLALSDRSSLLKMCLQFSFVYNLYQYSTLREFYILKYCYSVPHYE